MTNTTNTIEVTTLQVAENLRAMVEKLASFKNTGFDGEYTCFDNERLFGTGLSKVVAVDDVEEEFVSYLFEIRECNAGTSVFSALVSNSDYIEILNGDSFLSVADVIVRADAAMREARGK